MPKLSAGVLYDGLLRSFLTRSKVVTARSLVKCRCCLPGFCMTDCFVRSSLAMTFPWLSQRGVSQRADAVCRVVQDGLRRSFGPSLLKGEVDCQDQADECINVVDAKRLGAKDQQREQGENDQCDDLLDHL